MKEFIKKIFSYLFEHSHKLTLNKLLSKYNGKKLERSYEALQQLTIQEVEKILQSFSPPNISADKNECCIVLKTRNVEVKFFFSQDNNTLRYWGSSYDIKEESLLDLSVYGTSLSTGGNFVVYLKVIVNIDKKSYLFPITITIKKDLNELFLDKNANSK